MKIAYFGSSSNLSLTPFQTLIKSHHILGAVVVNNDLSNELNVIMPNTIESLAYKHSIPILGFDNQSANLDVQLSSIKPDLIIVSCFSKRIPSSVLSLAKYGGINIHPSLLPRYRGPDPLFWQYRGGVENFAITIHQLTAEFDAGDIIFQKKVNLVDGLNIEDAIQELAAKASELLIKSLHEIEKNNIAGSKQNQDLASYQSFPQRDDYSVNASWTAKRIYNFINAYKKENITFLCELDGRAVKLTSAISYQSKPYPDMNNESVVYKGNRVIFACKAGFIECEKKD